MKGLLKLVVLVIAIYVAFNFLRPELDRLTDGLGLSNVGGGGSEAVRCLNSAESTVDAFNEMVLKRGQPPISRSRWAGSYKLAEGRLQDARLTCECEDNACELANQSLDMLERHMERWNAAVSGGDPVLNGARTMEQIYGTIGRGRAIAR